MLAAVILNTSNAKNPNKFWHKSFNNVLSAKNRVKTKIMYARTNIHEQIEV